MVNDSGRYMRHVLRLADEIGPRPVGSAGNRAAQEYIARTMADHGFAVEVQEVPCPSWSPVAQRLIVGGRSLPIRANTFTRRVDVVAPVEAVGSLASLRRADLAGRVVVLYGELSREALFPKGFTAFEPERDREIVRALEECRPAVAVFVSDQPAPGSGGHVAPLTEDWDLDVPAATVSAEVGLVLLGASGRQVAVRLAVERTEAVTANVVGVLPGSRTERLVLCAHYDTKHGTPGASDNASGVAVLLELGTRLASAHLTCGLELVAFTSEEYVAPAEAAYLEGRGGSLDDVLLAVNFDGVGQALGTTSVALFLDSAEEAVVEQVRGRYPGVVRVEPWPQSNHYTFFSRGLPTIAFSSAGGAKVAHTPDDLPRWVSDDRLEEVADLAFDLALLMQHGRPVRRHVVR